MVEELDCCGLRVDKRNGVGPDSGAADGIRRAVEFTD